MAGMFGADVAQLRELAARFSQEADRLERDRMTVADAIQVRAWVGPIAIRFRHEWESSRSRSMLSAAITLRDAANRLRANADQQERASAVDDRQKPGGDSSTMPVPIEAGQQQGSVPFSDLVDEITRADRSGNGYYIDRFIGADGKVKYVMYISGTDTAPRLGKLDNVLAAQNIDSAAYRYFEEKLRAAVKEGGWGEVMVVGHSQGGFIAQSIADRSGLDVKTVVTIGSSPVPDITNFGGADVIHIADARDVVPYIEPAVRSNFVTSLIGLPEDLVKLVVEKNGTGDMYEPGLNERHRLFLDSDGLDRHGIKFYGENGAQIDREISSDGRASIDRFAKPAKIGPS